MPLNAGQSKLAADHFGMAVAIARRAAWGYGRQAVADADGLAAEGVCEAAVAWTGEGRFAAFLHCVVRRRVYVWASQQGLTRAPRYRARRRIRMHPISADTPLVYDDDRLTIAQSRDAVELHCAGLPDGPRHVLTRVYRDGWTITEAAAERGLGKSRGSWYHSEGIAALRAEAG